MPTKITHLNDDQIAHYAQDRAHGNHVAGEEIKQQVEQHIRRCLLCRDRVQDLIEVLQAPESEPSEQEKTWISEAVSNYMERMAVEQLGQEEPEPQADDLPNLLERIAASQAGIWQQWANEQRIDFSEKKLAFATEETEQQEQEFKDASGLWEACLQIKKGKVSFWFYSTLLPLDGKIKVILQAGEIAKEFVLERMSKEYIGHELVFSLQESQHLPPMAEWKIKMEAVKA
jgi:hypothetical protein